MSKAIALVIMLGAVVLFYIALPTLIVIVVAIIKNIPIVWKNFKVARNRFEVVSGLEAGKWIKTDALAKFLLHEEKESQYYRRDYCQKALSLLKERGNEAFNYILNFISKEYR